MTILKIELKGIEKKFGIWRIHSSITRINNKKILEKALEEALIQDEELHDIIKRIIIKNNFNNK